jgi:hypothetical protein
LGQHQPLFRRPADPLTDPIRHADRRRRRLRGAPDNDDCRFGAAAALCVVGARNERARRRLAAADRSDCARACVCVCVRACVCFVCVRVQRVLACRTTSKRKKTPPRASWAKVGVGGARRRAARGAWRRPERAGRERAGARSTAPRRAPRCQRLVEFSRRRVPDRQTCKTSRACSSAKSPSCCSRRKTTRATFPSARRRRRRWRRRLFLIAAFSDRRVFEKTLAYAHRFSKFKNKESVTHVRKSVAQRRSSARNKRARQRPPHRLLMETGFDEANPGANDEIRLKEYEIATLCNLCPEYAEEAIALVPTLQR